MTQITNVAIIGLFVQTNENISSVTHRFYGVVTDSYLEHTGPAKNFSREGSEGINVIPPACGSQCKDITSRDGSFT
jgi:hypothetical protein